jgi:hypothetical protein
MDRQGGLMGVDPLGNIVTIEPCPPVFQVNPKYKNPEASVYRVLGE